MEAPSVCDFCEKWVATTWSQHKNRLANMRGVPDAKTNPCPRCGGTYWAIKPPPGLPGVGGEILRYPPDVTEAEPLSWTWAMKLVGLSSAAILLAALFLLAMAYRAHAQATYRDSSGRLTGTATRDSNGSTTFRDASGRQTGTATTNGNGTTTFRDGSGRMTGTAERRR